MNDLNTRLGPGQASSTPKKEKLGGEPGFRNENTKAQYIRLPRYKPAAQLLVLLCEHVRRLLALLLQEV
jgi:hypothetical protein